MEGLKQESGRAYKEHYGEPADGNKGAAVTEEVDFDFVPGRGLVPVKR